MNPRWQKLLKEYVEALAVALILALIIRTFIIQAFKIPSESMLDTLLVGDHLLVSKFSYDIKLPFMEKSLMKTGDPQHGDVIVFEFPEDRSLDYIKRVIGVPGDTIQLKDNVLYRNGEKVDEPYKRLDPHGFGRPNFGPVKVPDGQYFMMGDNRDHSQDSRFWKEDKRFVPREYIRGKAWVIYWSWGGPLDVRWNRIGTIIK